GHDHLARDVAAHDDRVDAVELPGVEELPQAAVRPVDVRREEDLDVLHRAPRSTSSGSSYQGALRPTMLRARQRIDFAAAASSPSTPGSRPATVPAAGTSSSSGAAERTCARLSVTVVYQPQSVLVTARSRSSERVSAAVPAGPPSPTSWVSRIRTVSTTSL